MDCDHIQALAQWRALVSAIAAEDSTKEILLAMQDAEEEIRDDALTSKPVGPENAMALLTLCAEHVNRCGGRMSEDEFDIVCKASDMALNVMHGMKDITT